MYARLQRSSGSVYGVDGAIEICALAAGEDELLLSLWPTREEAAADPASEWYEVHTNRVCRDEPASVAMVLRFGGPLREPVRMAGYPGAVRAMTLWQPDRLNQVTVVLASSPPSMEDTRRVFGPDRVDLYQVLSLQAGTPR
jgi:hypothetical protein